MAKFNFFRMTEEDIDRIKSAVKSVEKESSGEVLPFIAKKSSRYKRYIYYTTFMTTLVALLVFIVMSWIADISEIYNVPQMYVFIFLQFFIFILLFLFYVVLFKCVPFLIPRNLKKVAVHKKALRTFFTEGVYKTRDRTGILIYISVFEKYIVVLADEGINSKIKENYWNGVVEKIETGFKNNNEVQAIVDAILMCKQVLVENFPVKSDDKNELKDLIIE